MPLSATGPLSVLEIANEFGVANQMSSFYSLAEGIPASGLITIGHFRGTRFPTGQAVFTGNGTFTFTVPAGVKSISMVAVQPGNYNGFGSDATVTVGGVVVCRARNGGRIGDGGGDGGYGGSASNMGGSGYYGGGAGGAGGYSGNGGNGGTYHNNTQGGAIFATAGSGGGGGGGCWGASGGSPGGYGPPGGGGGVGLLGAGANGGGAGASGMQGGGGSGGGGSGYNPDGGLYGGGHGVGYSSTGTSGGALSYKNNVAVTPGQQVTIVIGSGYRGGTTNNGAVRIIWGKNRAYPSTNTHDM